MVTKLIERGADVNKKISSIGGVKEEQIDAIDRKIEEIAEDIIFRSSLKGAKQG